MTLYKALEVIGGTTVIVGILIGFLYLYYLVTKKNYEKD